MALLGVLLIVPAVAIVVLGMLWFETWAAMTLWGWFAPWPLPFGLAAAMGMNMAVSLIVRSATRAKDERTSLEKWQGAFEHTVVVPLCALATGWVLKTWFI
jgi:hypothetical protein